LAAVIQADMKLRARRIHFAVLAAFAYAAMALLVPALASAAAQEYTVNVRSIGPGSPGCSPECTLPDAIEEANANSGKDIINFDPTVFQGAFPLSTITLASPLPEVKEEVEILGGRCPTGQFLEGPCVELTLSATASTSILIVEASGVTVEGIAFEGAGNGILVEPGETGFTAVGNWFGTGLNLGGGAANAAAGIHLGPGADGATIGGTDPTARNVFSRAEIGVYADGASSASIEGNYFGLQPDGSRMLGASVEQGVRIVDDTSTMPTTKAKNDEIGGVLAPTEAGTAKCDGACNAFAAEPEGLGIDLGGTTFDHDEAATGPTTIRGNYLGLTPDGTAPTGEWAEGIYAGPAKPASPTSRGPGEVTIGGGAVIDERNFFVGGEYGVGATGAEKLAVLGNEFGWTYAHAPTDQPTEAGILASSEGLAEGASIRANSMNAATSAGIESLFAGSSIEGNEIVGGSPAILTGQDDGGVGNLIASNTITEADTTGIFIENDSNLVRGNTITAAGAFGIEIEGEEQAVQAESNVLVGNTILDAAEIGIAVGSDATHNRIGGDGAGEANSIVGSGGGGEREGAIVIHSRTSGRNEVAANTGSGNSGPFIKLLSHGGPEEPNGGIQPPPLGAVLQSSATGTAQAGATVRIFIKADAEPGGLGARLATVTADQSGNWSATYPTVPTGTLVVATQTKEGGTSEVSAADSAAADPEKEKAGGGGTSGGGTGNSSSSGSSTPAPPPVKATAPAVKITKGPKKNSSSTTAKFVFKASPAAGATFECKLDGAKWAKCKPPKTYKRLKPGRHTFQARATVPGAPASKPAKVQFTIKS
jgi:hypothetical protein